MILDGKKRESEQALNSCVTLETLAAGILNYFWKRWRGQGSKAR